MSKPRPHHGIEPVGADQNIGFCGRTVVECGPYADGVFFDCSAGVAQVEKLLSQAKSKNLQQRRAVKDEDAASKSPLQLQRWCTRDHGSIPSPQSEIRALAADGA